MRQNEKDKVDDQAYASDEAAAAKLWSVYISEAEKYDRALVESWKSDMEGLLIFAGLFSASLTAFLIESYKTLSVDPQDLTVQLLTQISGQLANGSTLPASPPASFTAGAPSIICNGLWFISLGFSLACALIATLVQQWAREFLHRADMRSAPLIRARVFSYLYYGLKRFGMHTVVEIIPFLLHASVLLFFGGLVAFLIPVNLVMTVIAAILLFVVGSVYSAFTLLPLRFMDCPYRTPLSIAFWRLMHVIQCPWRYGQPDDAAQTSTLQDETMVETMFRTAVERSAQRSARDSRAIMWTIKSLTDDTELEPFIEAIPDLLWGPGGRPHTYLNHIQHLVEHPDVQLHVRLANLLTSCDTGILSGDVGKRRRITCYRAIWAIARLLSLSRSVEASKCSVNFATEYFDAFRHRYEQTPPPNSDIAPYFTSARTMSIWSMLHSIQGQLNKAREYLARCESTDRLSRNTDLTPAISLIPELYNKFAKLGFGDCWNPDLRQMTEELYFLLPYQLAIQYLSQSTMLAAPPYQWKETQAAISAVPPIPFVRIQGTLEFQLDSVISYQLDRINAAPDIRNVDWITRSISALLSFWRPEHITPIPRAILRLLNGMDSEVALKDTMRDGLGIELALWRNFPSTLLSRKWSLQSTTALWRLASLNLNPSIPDDSRLVYLNSVLDTVTQTNSAGHISRSIIALVKLQAVDELSIARNITVERALSVFNHRLLPEDTANPIPEHTIDRNSAESTRISDSQWNILDRVMGWRKTEAGIVVLAEFLEHCGTEPLPYKAVETLNKMNSNIIPFKVIHPRHQVRLASAIEGVFAATQFTDSQLLTGVINCVCWSLYAMNLGRPLTSRDPAWVPWLDDPAAWRKIKDIFTQYERRLSADTAPGPGEALHAQGDSDVPDIEEESRLRAVRDRHVVLTRVRNILDGLDHWHRDLSGTDLET
ncbi:hypothetical protein MVEN_01653000 [Mycena venus]|uniref:DUF6535 domain-containing protein n=1 Tax=Mycena venus TaxID=2733690 RepID=A0A8H7CQV8_9AGAR|nr:hypothetical protein MVEN_01653000 [Mycena venus]